MDTDLFIQTRLANQQISRTKFQEPLEIVSWFGAMQAQDYTGAKWGIGLRLPAANDLDIDRAISEKTIVRTWPMRGTLHFVARDDIRWMLRLLTPRVISGSAARQKNLELDAHTFAKSFDTLTKALAGGKQLTRLEIMKVLEKAGISTTRQRGYHLLWRAAQEGFICFGPMEGKQQTFVLLDDWIPKGSNELFRDESLAEITRRYFQSHGPAAIRDFMWWSGLKAAEIKEGIQMLGAALSSEEIADETYWFTSNSTKTKTGPSAFFLPGFDEYLLGYRNRTAVLDPKYAERIVPGGNGVFRPIVLLEGKVRGVWKKTIRRRETLVEIEAFDSLSKKEKEILSAAAERYSAFMRNTVRIEFPK